MKPNLSKTSKADLVQERRVFANRIAKRLQKIRKSKNMTQEQLAYKAGYSRNMIGNFEQAINSPTAHTLWRLSNALDVEVSEFFKDL